MASPQKENGYTAIANELLEKIISSGLNGTEFAIMLFVLRKTYGYQKKEDEISLSQFLKAIPVSRQTVCTALSNLQLVKILRLVKKGSSKLASNLWVFNKNYDEWQLVKKTRLVKKSATTSQVSRHQLVKKTRHTKETIQKKDTKEILSAKADEEFSSKIEIDKYLASTQRHIHLIGLYWRYLKIQFENKEQLKAQLKRNLKSATDLIGYSDERIIATMKKLDDITNFGEKFKWTLETILKYINE